jgi:hypothetical protein
MRAEQKNAGNDRNSALGEKGAMFWVIRFNWFEIQGI